MVIFKDNISELEAFILSFGLNCIFIGLLGFPSAYTQQSIRLPLNVLIKKISTIAVPCLAIMVLRAAYLMTHVGPAPSWNVWNDLIAGGLKAITWCCFFYIVSNYLRSIRNLALTIIKTQHTTWEIAPSVLAFVELSTADLSTVLSPQSALACAFIRIGSAIVFLLQTIDFLPLSSKKRKFLAILVVLPIVALLGPSRLAGNTNLIRGAKHPVKYIMQKAEMDWRAKLGKQSRSFNDAVTEYKRRYKRDPPPGFAAWYEFASENDVPLIDEYDQIQRDLEPFQKISPKQLNRDIQHIVQENTQPAFKVGWQNGEWIGGDCYLCGELRRMMEEIQDRLPNITLLLNDLDEPVEIINPLLDDRQRNEAIAPHFVDLSHTPIWNEVIEACSSSPHTPERNSVHDYTLPFLQDVPAARDLCLHPQYANQYGFFNSPTTFKLTRSPVPILSQTTPSTFNDILIPSPRYETVRHAYNDSEDIPWAEKSPVLYWAGSTTGGQANTSSWRNWQRQRFVTLANPSPSNTNSTYKFLSRSPITRKWHLNHSTDIQPQLYNVHFTTVFNCAEDICDEERAFYESINATASYAAVRDSYASRLVMDLDGNSFSVRFYTLLKSRSAALRQTLMQEWHDDRLMPWVHYVPISLGMEELPEVVRWMSLTKEGDKAAERIGEQGREWAGKALRRVDLQAYTWRLLLEMARLLDERSGKGDVDASFTYY